MSTSSKLLWKIKEAVIKNTCRPLPDEVEELDLKCIRVSALREGDSQIGIMLFIGIAKSHGFTDEDISSAEGIEYSEIKYKLGKYNDKIKSDRRFYFKTVLINNYIRLN